MLEVKELPLDKKNLKEFTKFQINLYKGNPYYVPPLIMDDVNTLLPSKNPAFDFCEAAIFMAYRDGKPVARVAGIINHQLNKMHGHKEARFGFIDFDNFVPPFGTFALEFAGF